jgi:hypothetical protein
MRLTFLAALAILTALLVAPASAANIGWVIQKGLFHFALPVQIDLGGDNTSVIVQKDIGHVAVHGQLAVNGGENTAVSIQKGIHDTAVILQAADNGGENKAGVYQDCIGCTAAVVQISDGDDIWSASSQEGGDSAVTIVSNGY